MSRTLEERINGPEAEPWIPETAGEYVIGELEEISEREGDYGPYKVLTLLTNDDNVVSVAGFGTVLKGKFDSLGDGDLGCNVAVKYLGERSPKRAGGKPYKDWMVSVERKAVSTVAGSGDFSDDDDI